MEQAIIMAASAIGAGLAIGLAAIGAGIGDGLKPRRAEFRPGDPGHRR